MRYQIGFKGWSSEPLEPGSYDAFIEKCRLVVNGGDDVVLAVDLVVIEDDIREVTAFFGEGE